MNASAQRPLERLASVELSLLFHCLDNQSAVALSRCNRALQQIACTPFTWAGRDNAPLFCIPTLPAEAPHGVEEAEAVTLARQVATAALNCSLVRIGGLPVSIRWQGVAEAVSSELTNFLTLPRLASLDCSARKGLDDSHLQQIADGGVAIKRSLRRLRIGGYYHKMTAEGLRIVCEGLPNLTALSVDHVVDEALLPNDQGEFDGRDNPLCCLPIYASGLRSLEIRRWLAEVLSPADLVSISSLSHLTSLYLENLEPFTPEQIATFWNSSTMRGIKHLSLSHIDLGTLNVRRAFEPEIAVAEAAAPPQVIAAEHFAAADPVVADVAPPVSVWSNLINLQQLSLIRCRSCHTLIPHIIPLLKLEVFVIRGALDSWGVEIPRREDILRLMRGAPHLKKLQLFAQTAKPEDLANLHAQLGSVNRVEFFNGSIEEKNPGAF